MGKQIHQPWGTCGVHLPVHHCHRCLDLPVTHHHLQTKTLPWVAFLAHTVLQVTAYPLAVLLPADLVAGLLLSQPLLLHLVVEHWHCLACAL